MSMPKFFMPYLTSEEKAERAYNELVKSFRTYKLADPSARLYSITFPEGRAKCVATVGKEIRNFPDKAGTVLAIIETTGVILVHTERRCGGTAIMVLPDEASHFIYFDDYPAQS